MCTATKSEMTTSILVTLILKLLLMNFQLIRSIPHSPLIDILHSPLDENKRYDAKKQKT